MAITINGTGSITGLTAGGLPDGSVTTDDLAADAVTSAKIASGTIVDADVNASAAIADSKLTGTTCKAWVSFDGTGTVSIRGSGNVSSITDNGTGEYTVNFTTALTDGNYSSVVSSNQPQILIWPAVYGGTDPSPTTVRVRARNNTGTPVDCEFASIAIFR